MKSKEFLIECNYTNCVKECAYYQTCIFTKHNNPSHEEYFELIKVENMRNDLMKKKQELIQELGHNPKDTKLRNRINIELNLVEDDLKNTFKELNQKRRSLGLL